MGEYTAAEQCLRKLYKVDPSNKEAARMLVKVQEAVRRETDKQKLMFSKMAKGLGSTEDSAQLPVADETLTSAVPEANGEQTFMRENAEETLQAVEEDAGGFPWLEVLAIAGIAACTVAAVVALRRQRRM